MFNYFQVKKEKELSSAMFSIMEYDSFYTKKSHSNTLEDFSKHMKSLIKIENSKKIIPFILATSEISLLLFKAKFAYLGSDFDLARDLLAQAKIELLKKNDTLAPGLYDIFLFSNEFLDIQVEVATWINKWEDSFLIHKNSINEKKSALKEIEQIIVSYKENSPEYLKLSEKYLNIVVNMASDMVKLEDSYSNAKLTEEGELIFLKLENFEKKMLNFHFIFSDLENNFSHGRQGFASLFLLEKLKVQYYLKRENKHLFNCVYEIIKYQSLNHNRDPLSFLLKEGFPEEIRALSPWEKQTEFNQYIKTFNLTVYEINQEKNYLFLKQMINMSFDSLNRIKRQKIKNENELNEILKN